MTIKEFIAELQAYPNQDAVVCMWSACGDDIELVSGVREHVPLEEKALAKGRAVSLYGKNGVAAVMVD